MTLSFLNLLDTEITFDFGNGVVSIDTPNLTRTGRFLAGLVVGAVIVTVGVAILQEVAKNR